MRRKSCAGNRAAGRHPSSEREPRRCPAAHTFHHIPIHLGQNRLGELRMNACANPLCPTNHGVVFCLGSPVRGNWRDYCRRQVPPADQHRFPLLNLIHHIGKVSYCLTDIQRLHGRILDQQVGRVDGRRPERFASLPARRSPSFPIWSRPVDEREGRGAGDAHIPEDSQLHGPRGRGLIASETAAAHDDVAEQCPGENSDEQGGQE